jgi:hypothetical protein
MIGSPGLVSSDEGSHGRKAIGLKNEEEHAMNMQEHSTPSWSPSCGRATPS